MKRMHIHISVDDLASARRFYSAMFALEPSVSKHDYAKWELENPSINLAISERGESAPGIDHVGIQVDNSEELGELHQRLSEARYSTVEQLAASCCYAESDKHWAADPAGVVWEMFHTMGEATVYGEDRAGAVRPLASHG